jgi:hypothetical protein
MLRTCGLAAVFLFAAGTPSASAWGCDGHRAVALIAERLLSPAAVASINRVLAASPIDAAIKPYCPPLPLDPIADASTWADDNRAIDPSTAPWHFIDFPTAVGSHNRNYKQYCPAGKCVIDAIVAQFQALTTTADLKVKGNALRYLIHFVGDLHQPLHASTNGDRGGNCLPVTYLSERPQEDERHNWRPNLHGVWDDGLIRRLMSTNNLADSRALADYIAAQASLSPVAARWPSAKRVTSWARDASSLSRKVTYGKLQTPPPTEPAAASNLLSCDDNNHVGRRMAVLHEEIDRDYEQVSVRAIISQIRLAGERLASVLKAAFPE